MLYNVNTGEHLNELDNYAVRGQLLWVPTDSVKLRLIGDVTDLDSVCCSQNFLRVGESLRSPARQFPALAAGLGYEPPSRNVYDRLSDIDAALQVKTQEGGVSLIADWDWGPATLTSVTAWRYWDWDVANDRDYTGIPIQMVQRIPSRQDQYSQEFRIASNGDARLRYVGGICDSIPPWPPSALPLEFANVRNGSDATWGLVEPCILRTLPKWPRAPGQHAAQDVVAIPEVVLKRACDVQHGKGQQHVEDGFVQLLERLLSHAGG